MNITVESIKENEDGSADCSIVIDEGAKNFLIRYALIHCMMEAAEFGEKATPPEGQDEH